MKRLKHGDWARGGPFWRGVAEGKALGTGVTILFFASDEVGAGAGLHTHPYDEVFVVREGRALYVIGDEQVEAEAGEILLAPAGVPHAFRNLGPGRLETTDIHLSPEWIQTDLDPADGSPG